MNELLHFNESKARYQIQLLWDTYLKSPICVEFKKTHPPFRKKNTVKIVTFDRQPFLRTTSIKKTTETRYEL
jgi:hypothetical protein